MAVPMLDPPVLVTVDYKIISLSPVVMGAAGVGLKGSSISSNARQES